MAMHLSILDQAASQPRLSIHLLPSILSSQKSKKKERRKSEEK